MFNKHMNGALAPGVLTEAGRKEAYTMLMFAVALFFILFGFAILSIPFWVLLSMPREEAHPPAEEAEGKPAPVAVGPSRFFADTGAPLVQVPASVLVSRIEDHVRLEQAAAKSFVESPTAVLLHAPTASPFVN